MKDRLTQSTDQLITELLTNRAPHGADQQLVAAIVALAAVTPQRRSRFTLSIGGRPVPGWALVLLAVGLALALTVGGLVAGGVVLPRLRLSQVPTTPSPSASARTAQTPAPAPSERSVTTSGPTMPGTAFGLAQFLPDRLCGVPATPQIADTPGSQIGREPLYGALRSTRIAALEDAALAASVPLTDALYAVTASEWRGSCPGAAIFRIPGADPAVSEAAVLDSTRRGALVSCTALVWGPDDAIDCKGGPETKGGPVGYETYYRFVGDAIVVVIAADETSARSMSDLIVTAIPGYEDDVAAAPVMLPDSEAALAGLLPDRLCGVPATKGSGLAASQLPQSTLTLLGDVAISAGRLPSASRYAQATSENGSGRCPAIAITRLPGVAQGDLAADLRTEIRRAGGDQVCTWLRLAGGDVLDCAGGRLGGYFAVMGDAVVVVDAVDDVAAADAFGTLPISPTAAPGPVPPMATTTTYRTQFGVPFTLTLDHRWAVTTDTPRLVVLTDSEMLAPHTLRFILPYGYRDADAVMRSLGSLRYPPPPDGPGTLVSSWLIPGLADKVHTRIGPLAGWSFVDYGEASIGFRPLFATTLHGKQGGVSTALAIDAAGDYGSDWFGFKKGESGWVFVTEFGGRPVAVVASPWLGGPRSGNDAFLARVRALLATVTVSR